jgi:hypothetical protein
MDVLHIPQDTGSLLLSAELPSTVGDTALEASVDPVDGGPAPQPSGTVVHSTAGRIIATVTLPAPPDGDYVLRLRSTAGGRSDIVATQAFRVARVQR